MRITLLIPGTGSFFCGSCLRDNALAKGLRALGHEVAQVPLYLPFFLEEEHDANAAARMDSVHMGGINMYLQQKLPLLRHLPRALAKLLDRPGLLRWASTKGNMTDASALGDMTLSMLSGERGRQRSELDKLITWLAEQPRSDVFILSNAMLIGIARRLKEQLGTPVICTLQGEAPFLDALDDRHRQEAWRILAERARDVDLFVPVSAFTRDLMSERMQLEPQRMQVVHNGLDLEDYPATDATHASDPQRPPVIGYLARLCEDKGLPTLVDAFIELHRRGQLPGLRLRAAGVEIAADRKLLRTLRARIAEAGLEEFYEIRSNVSRKEKIELLASIDVLSVPATYGESFGLYMLEAMAHGVPVVQPRSGAFPEVIEATGGGLLFSPDDAHALADHLQELLSDPQKAAQLGATGKAAVHSNFNLERMARDLESICNSLLSRSSTSG